MYYDLWPPSQQANHKLGNAQENESFQFALNEVLNDPIKQLVLKYYGIQEANKRILPNADTVIADANGLQILIVRKINIQLYIWKLFRSFNIYD
jgi:hypothetical protein